MSPSCASPGRRVSHQRDPDRTDPVRVLNAAAAFTPTPIVAFLAGPDGRWLTGQNLHASRGLG